MAGPYLIGRIDMFTRFIMASAVSVTLAFSSAAFAASTDFIDNNTFTTDTISGLDWRDVTASLNRSYNDVSGQFGVGGDFEGYRYATGTEFNQVINNFSGSQVGLSFYDRYIHTQSYIKDLAIMFGAVNLDPDNIRIQGIINEAHVYTDQTIRQYTAMMDYYNGVLKDGTTSTLVTSFAHGSEVDNSIPSANIASFLVRDSLIATPIPAAAFMFAPALLGFMGLRRRAKNAVA
jgi:hypothetical protein